MRFRLILGIGTTLPAAGKVSAQINAAYRVKAAFLYKCAKFLEWPPDVWTGPHCSRQIQAPGPIASDSGRGVLSMGECPSLADPGGVITFKMEGAPRRFKINLAAADEHTLIISSKPATLREGHTEIA
jgi:hypothetical protein